ncbi:MAG: hypothetical protein AAF293_00695 [Pseudomonadota bacterium]
MTNRENTATELNDADLDQAIGGRVAHHVGGFRLPAGDERIDYDVIKTGPVIPQIFEKLDGGL